MCINYFLILICYYKFSSYYNWCICLFFFHFFLFLSYIFCFSIIQSLLKFFRLFIFYCT